MRTLSCRNCGTVFETGNRHTTQCPDCAAKARSASVIRPRVCIDCGCTFDGYPASLRCPPCRKEAIRATSRKSKRCTTRKLGSTDLCKKCGGEYIVNGGRQMYCPDCAESAFAETYRPQKAAYSAEYVKTHPKPKRSKVCDNCGNIFISAEPTVYCSTECATQGRLQKARAWESEHRDDRNARQRERRKEDKQ